MEKLTKIEKEAVAFLIRQEINEGERILEEIERALKTETDKEIFNQAKEGHQARKQRFETIARKLEIEL